MSPRYNPETNDNYIMKYTHPISSSQSGSILLTVMITLFILSLTLGGFLTQATQHFYSTMHKMDHEQAFYLAEAGLEVAAEYVKENMDLLPSSYSGTGTIGSGSFSYTITKSEENDFECSIYAEGIFNGSKRAVELEGVRNATFATYSFYAADNGSIYFKSGEEFFGHVHTGSKPYFSGNPTFNDAFTTEADKYEGSITDVTFKDGFDMDVDKGSVGDIAAVNFANYKVFASTYTDGLLLSGETAIEFDDDQVLITNSEKGWSKEKVSLDDVSLIYVEDYTVSSKGKTTTYPGDLQLNGGTIDGRLTVFSENDTYINDHIEYTVYPIDEDGNDAEGADDALGIVSGDDVVVTSSAPSDLKLNATIMATGALAGDGDDGSFYVQNYSSGSAKGDLNLYGGIIQEKRGAVGTFNTKSGKLTTGYDKQYSFDTRFESAPPPYFPPVESKLTYDKWAEVKPKADNE